MTFKNFKKQSGNSHVKGMRKIKSPTDFHTELEALTNEMIAEAVGPSGILKDTFNEYLGEIKAQQRKDPTATLSPEQVDQIMITLISQAASIRTNFLGRIHSQISHGKLFQEYFQKLKKIVDIDVQIDLKQKCVDDEHAKVDSAQGLLDELYESVRIHRKSTSKEEADPDYTPEEEVRFYSQSTQPPFDDQNPTEGDF